MSSETRVSGTLWFICLDYLEARDNYPFTFIADELIRILFLFYCNNKRRAINQADSRQDSKLLTG